MVTYCKMVDDCNLILDRGMWVKPKTVRFNPGHVGLNLDRRVLPETFGLNTNPGQAG